MSTQKLWGTSILQDEQIGIITLSKLALMTDGDGRSEVHITNTETGDLEILEFSGEQWKPVAQMIEAIRSVHASEALEPDTA